MGKCETCKHYGTELYHEPCCHCEHNPMLEDHHVTVQKTPKLIVEWKDGFTMYYEDFRPLKEPYMKLLNLFSKLFEVLPDPKERILTEEKLKELLLKRLDELLPTVKEEEVTWISTDEECPECGNLLLYDPATGKTRCDSEGCDFSGFMDVEVRRVD